MGILLDYAGAVPLWSGVMLKHLGKTRDSNAIVKNWFRTKNKCGSDIKAAQKSRRFSVATGRVCCGKNQRDVTEKAGTTDETAFIRQ